MRDEKSAEVQAGKRLIADEELVRYLSVFLRRNDPALLEALGSLARIKGMTQLSRETGISRATLYRALSIDADPNFSSILKVTHALGFRLRFEVLSTQEE